MLFKNLSNQTAAPFAESLKGRVPQSGYAFPEQRTESILLEELPVKVQTLYE